MLLSNSISFLHWYPQWNDTGRKICCTPDIPISPLDVPCYTLTILCELTISVFKEILVSVVLGYQHWAAKCGCDKNLSSVYTVMPLACLDKTHVHCPQLATYNNTILLFADWNIYAGSVYVILIRNWDTILHTDPPIPVPTRWPAGINKYPVLGSPFELHCPLQSNPPANYTWTYHSLDGRERLSIPNDVILTDRGRRIIFTEYTANYNGIYECHAENELGAEDYSNDGLFFLKPNGRRTETNSLYNSPYTYTLHTQHADFL